MPSNVLLLIALLLLSGVECNQPPVFTADMRGLILNESVPVGTVVYTLMGYDPENSELIFSVDGSDKLEANPTTGEVTLVQPLDYETEHELTVLVSIEDRVDASPNDNNDVLNTNNKVSQPATVIITDVNDNPPYFLHNEYEIEVDEDTPAGTTIFSDLIVKDSDTVGEVLDVTCSSKSHPEDSCGVITIQPTTTNESYYHGVVILNRRLNYLDRQLYQIAFLATDGALEGRTILELKVRDVQNTPPVFTTSLVGVISENASIGTHIMTVHARDGDTGHPREVRYELLSNPMDYFLLDARSGELKTGKLLDKEALSDSTGVLNFQIRAYEIENGERVSNASAMKTETVTITIRDVNDEPPKFNHREFSVEIPENLPAYTPLPRLDMTVSDRDTGHNAAFSLRLADAAEVFAVDPAKATGATSVSIRVSNMSLDYENPNERKFIIRVIAEELGTNPKLSSTATVTVMVADINDNPPTFPSLEASASVIETAAAGTPVTALIASDRDSGPFGPESIVYTLDGNGSERFKVDYKRGVVTVAECETPGQAPCLDLETKAEYHLTIKATDTEGAGLSAQATLHITLLDANDNPPRMAHARYRGEVEEGARELQPPLFVTATDADATSELEYSIIRGNELGLFTVDTHTGQLHIKTPPLDLTVHSTPSVNLIVQASDGRFTDNATVSISIADVNNNAPIFSQPIYYSNIPENSPSGASVGQISAEDADSGDNAAIRYLIYSGGFNDFHLDSDSGLITVTSQLDYDRRSNYSVVIHAVDKGIPPQTGTTIVEVHVINSNDKAPVVSPATQRTQVSEAASVGDVIHTINVDDPDAEPGGLQYELVENISAIDANGQPVHSTDFKEWFKADGVSGKVFVAKKLRRELAAVVTLTVVVTDLSAPSVQQGRGTLIVTITDVNDHKPTFTPPWTVENPRYQLNVVEGWSESPIATLTATDKDSAIAYYAIMPPSDQFTIDNATGIVRLQRALDFEEAPTVSFTAWAFDTGDPQLSSSALVTVQITNINDHDPVFSQPKYSAEVAEGSGVGTLVVTVAASDRDRGEYGELAYSLIGSYADNFSMGALTGEIRVLDPNVLDRESRSTLRLEVVAQDGGPPDTRRSATAVVEVTVLDVNDNAPVFAQPFYSVFVMENLALSPPTPIAQPHADDPDAGANGTVTYAIVHGNPDDTFRIDTDTGIIYPAKSLRGGARVFSLIIEGKDGGGLSAQTRVEISVRDVNENKPIFDVPSELTSTVHVSEGQAVHGYRLLTVLAKDADSGENGRVSYHFKVNNSNVQETEEFKIDPDTGELTLRTILDRESQASYQVVLVAIDHGSIFQLETLQQLSVIVDDENDNAPMFLVQSYEFSVTENNLVGLELGRVHAVDRDVGNNARIYYSIVAGNDDELFGLERTTGAIIANGSLDRETQQRHQLVVRASNDPAEFLPHPPKKRDLEHDRSLVRVVITVLDENDNVPTFPSADYHVGVKAGSVLNELVTQVQADDMDGGINGTVEYIIQASNLYKSGAKTSSGSVVPSPFSVSADGKIMTAAVMAEYTHDRFLLTVLAREAAPPHRAASTTLHVWVYEPQQVVRVVLSRPPEEVHRSYSAVVAELSNATRSLVVVDDIRYHVDSQREVRRDWTDLYLHAVDQETQTILNTDQVLKAVDAQYDFLKDRYTGFAIENVMPVVEEPRAEPIDAALAALVALLIVLFVGCVTFIVVCCCLRNWVLALPGKDDLHRKDTLMKHGIPSEPHTTENPLWIEQKLKLYEEQELTMQVFMDELKHHEDNMSQHEDNTYATIQNPHRVEDGADYETLNTHRAQTPKHQQMVLSQMRSRHELLPGDWTGST